MRAVDSGADPLAISIAALPYSCRHAAAALAYANEPTREDILAALQTMTDEIHSLRTRMGHALADKDHQTRLAVNRGYEVATNCAEHGRLLAEQRDQINALSSSLDRVEDERKDWVGLVHAVADQFVESKPMIEKVVKRIMAARSRRESRHAKP